jgi:hypothetical protein
MQQSLSLLHYLYTTGGLPSDFYSSTSYRIEDHGIYITASRLKSHRHCRCSLDSSSSRGLTTNCRLLLAAQRSSVAHIVVNPAFFLLYNSSQCWVRMFPWRAGPCEQHTIEEGYHDLGQNQDAVQVSGGWYTRSPKSRYYEEHSKDVH